MLLFVCMPDFHLTFFFSQIGLYAAEKQKRQARETHYLLGRITYRQGRLKTFLNLFKIYFLIVAVGKQIDFLH